MSGRRPGISRLLNPATTLAAGLLLGAVSRLLDLYTQNLGNIFSQLAIWILLGTLIALYSPTRRQAMVNILPFCLGMLASYYAAAALTHGVYSRTIIAVWTLFALCSPVLAALAWTAKCPGLFPKLIGAGIVLTSIVSSILFFDRLRFYDLIIDSLLIYFLFFAKIRRPV